MRHLFYKKPGDDTEFLAVWDVTTPIDDRALATKIPGNVDTAYIAEGKYSGRKFVRGRVVHTFFEGGFRSRVEGYAA